LVDIGEDFWVTSPRYSSLFFNFSNITAKLF
jgi:hypothetical protein